MRHRVSADSALLPLPTLLDIDARWRPTGAPRDCWFDVLEPPTAQQLKDCLRPGAAAAAAAGGGEGGEVLADSDDEAPGRCR